MGFKRGGGDYENAPEGLHPAVCIDVVELGEVKKPWGDEDTVRFIFALDPSMRNSKGELYHVRLDCKNTLHEKGNLHKHLKSWRGRALEKTDMDFLMTENGPDKLIGVNCQVQIIHNRSDNGGIYANVQAVMPALKGVAKLLVPNDYVRVKNRPKDHQQRTAADRAAASNGPAGWGDDDNAGNPAEDDDIPF